MKLLDNILTACSNVAPLAEGGQKKVLSADHPDYGSIVIKYGEYRHSSSLERITREVQLLGELSSEYFPRNFDFIIDPVKRHFLIVEERLDAEELSCQKGQFDSDEKIEALLRHLILGLDHLWRRKVIHRDIKPANILVTREGMPRIIDLGIARFLDETSLTASLAMQGPGTPYYAAPEQLLNRKAMISPRTDFFLLGVLSLELLLGFHPFDPVHVGNNSTTVENLLDCTHVPVPESVTPLLAKFFRNTLQREPYKRFRTANRLLGHFGLERDR